jgi:putative DNA primase/helicase
MTAAAIVKAIGGRWHGNYGLARCICHDDGTTPALKISDDPRKSDGIDLHCFAGCDWRDIKSELVKRGLLSAARGASAPREVRKITHLRSGPAEHPNREAAVALWQSGLPADGTPVETYLGNRGIHTLPSTLRYLPDAKHAPTGLTFPCMLAAVTVWPSKTVHAVHRTFLTADGARKAQVSESKMMLGPCAGGAVRLAPVTNEMAIAEGIETALAAMQATGIPTWAAMSTSGLRSVVLPREARSVVILADNDENGAGQDAAEALARRLTGEGRRVRIAYPPGGVKDFNDTLLAGAA